MADNIKLVVVGDDGVGKTCLLITWVNNSFPDDYVPTVFDNYGATTLFHNYHIGLGYWDTAGHEDYGRLRPLSYPDTQVFLVVFDVSNRISFEHIETNWFPEVQEHAPGIPIIVVGNKIDLRTDRPCVSTGEGMAMAMKLGAVSYVETSCKEYQNLRRPFYDAMTVVLIGHGQWKYYIPEDDKFVRTKLLRKSKIVVSSVEEFRKYNFSGCIKTFKEVKKDLLKAQKEVKNLKNHLKNLSDDVIFHIFHFFYLFDFRSSCTFYRNEHMFYKEKLQKSFDFNIDPDVLLQCFGYFSRDNEKGKRKRIFQLFYNFQVRNHDYDLKLLPKLKRSLIVSNNEVKNRVILFRDYMNLNIDLENKIGLGRKVQVVELRNIRFPVGFDSWSRFIEHSLEKLDLTISSNPIREEFNSYDFLSILNNKCHDTLTHLTLHRERPILETIRVCRFDRNEFKMKSLRKLVLRGYVMNEDLSFSGCSSLEEVSFVGYSNQYPLELFFHKKQMEDLLLKLRKLRKIRFLFYNLVGVESVLNQLLSEYDGVDLSEIVIHRCVFNYRYLKPCSFRNLRNLKLLVITHHLELGEDQEEFPRDFLIRVGERTKDFQFLLRSSQKGAFSNMKQRFKLKVIREIDGYAFKNDLI